MPRAQSTAPNAAAQLRRLQARLPELSVPALLRVRDAIEPVLEREAIRPADVETVLRAGDED